MSYTKSTATAHAPACLEHFKQTSKQATLLTLLYYLQIEQLESEDEMWMLPNGGEDEPPQVLPLEHDKETVPVSQEQRRYPLRPRHPPQ